jgi:hypothetical protein
VAFALPGREQRRKPRHEDLRLIPLPEHSRVRTGAPPARAKYDASRGDVAPGAGATLTLAFLIAGAFIVAALTFWSGPEEERTTVSVQQPESAASTP